jgi:hypothetical protein
MDAKRARILAGSALVMSLLMATWAAPAAAADCTLSAPAYVNVGTPLTIEGSGFAASTSVDIAFSLDGTASDAFTVQSTADGALQIALTPEDIDIGVTTVHATAGTACTAQVTYTVLAAGATPPPSPEPGDSSGTGATPTPPRTDTEAPVGHDGVSGAALWLLALALVAAGSTGLFWTRSTRRH